MADLSTEELRAILQEQRELRLRLVALDRKIDLLAFEQPRRPPPSVAPVEETPVAEPIRPPEPLPPVLRVDPGPAPDVLPVSPLPPPFVDAPPVAKSSWEFQLGTVWLVRIGIVILLTGLVFLGNYAYHHIVPRIGPWVKLALLYTLGGALAWLGARLEKGAEALRNYGRVLLAGGAAMLYYTTYGATFVERLRVIESPLPGGLLLLGVGAAVVWLAEKRQAQSVALLAILLSYYTSAINPVGSFSLYSSLLLTAAAVYFLLRHRWTKISFLSLAGTYGSYAFWRFYRAGEGLSFAERLPTQVWQGAVFLLGYWLLFTAAVFLSRASQFSPEKRTPFLTLNNAAFYGLVFQILQANFPGWTGRFSLLFGAVLLALAWFARRRQTEDLFLDGAYLVQGLSVLTFGLLTELNGYQLSLALALQGTLMLFSINRRHGWIYEIGAAIVTLLAWRAGAAQGANLAHAATTGWSFTALLIADAWLLKNFKKRGVPPAFSWQAAGYSLLAIWQLSLVLPLHFSSTPAALTATVALIVLGTAIRLPELAVTSQIFVLTTSFAYVFALEKVAGVTLPVLVFLPLLLMHWWQRRKEGDPWKMGELLFAVVFLANAVRCLFDRWQGTELEFSLGLLAIATLVYGALGGAQILALLGQTLLFWVASMFFVDAFFHSLARLWPTLQLGLVGLDLYLWHLLAAKFPENAQPVVLRCRQMITGLFFAMLAAWGLAYLEAPARLLYFEGVASALLLVAFRFRQKPGTAALLAYAGGFAVSGLLLFWQNFLQGAPASWLDVLALLLLAADERLLRKIFPATEVLQPVRGGLIMAAVSGFWLEWNRWIDLSGSHFPKTLAWALLGTVSLCAGLAIRERTYRVCGLALLAMATVRVFVNDIWGLDPIFRILSFIVLGVVLLALGFIYNKFAEKLKEWL